MNTHLELFFSLSRILPNACDQYLRDSKKNCFLPYNGIQQWYTPQYAEENMSRQQKPRQQQRIVDAHQFESADYFRTNNTYASIYVIVCRQYIIHLCRRVSRIRRRFLGCDPCIKIHSIYYFHIIVSNRLVKKGQTQRDTKSGVI
jgi:hypothetical protein